MGSACTKPSRVTTSAASPAVNSEWLAAFARIKSRVIAIVQPLEDTKNTKEDQVHKEKMIVIMGSW
jgi:hypothetical protein